MYPATAVVCLGILIDTTTLKMSVSPAKFQEIKYIVNEWSHKKTCTKAQLQSLLGSLLFISKCVKHSRFFLNRMLATLRQSKNDKCVKLDQDFHRDVNWLKKIVNSMVIHFLRKKPSMGQCI